MFPAPGKWFLGNSLRCFGQKKLIEKFANLEKA
jgi:hypothetical protein